MTKRVQLTGGHSEIAVAGQHFLADEDGCFTVTDEVAMELQRTYGKEYVTYVPGIEVLQEQAEEAEAQVSNLKRQLELAEATAHTARTALGAYVAKSKAAADARRPQSQNQNQQQNHKQK